MSWVFRYFHFPYCCLTILQMQPQAIQRLDESVRMMMTEATNINGGGGNGYDDDDDVVTSGKPKRYSSQSYTAAASSSSLKKKVSKKSANNGVLSTSVQVRHCKDRDKGNLRGQALAGSEPKLPHL